MVENSIFLFTFVFALISSAASVVLLYMWRKKGIPTELRKIREVLESQYNVDFGESFGHSEGFAFLIAIGNAINRFEKNIKGKRSDVNVDYEARGLIAALKLFISWAKANKEVGLQRKAEEKLKRAKEVYQNLR